MDENTPEAWYASLPLLTKIGLTSIFGTTALAVFGMINPMLIILDWNLIFDRWQIWRIFTNICFFGKFSFPMLIQLYFFTSFSTKLERHERFTSKPGDFLFFLVFQAALLSVLSLLSSYPSGDPLLGPAFVFSIIYYWSRCEPEARLSYFGFTIKGFQFPFAMMLFSLLMGGSVWMDVLGVASGHIYHFLRDIVPVEYGYSFLRTPEFMHKVMMKHTGTAAARDYQPDTGFRAFGGGGGQRLGG